MTITPTVESPSDFSFERVAAAAGTARAEAALNERTGRLSDRTLDALRDAGLFRMLQPRACGGLQRPLPDVLQALELVARADGAAGWCVMIGAGSNALSAWLAPHAAREVFAAPDTIAASVFSPTGLATPVEGGYRVSGRWSYGSGVQHSAWVLGSCRVEGAEDGPNARLQVFMPRADVEIVPNWDVIGLRATGSHDFEVSDVFVPADRTLRFSDGPRDEGVLYALPFQAQIWLWFAPVPLGIARASLDAFRAACADGTMRRSGPADAHVNTRYAEAEGALRAARAFLSDVSARAWQTVTDGRTLDAEDVAEIGVMVRHAAITAARVTEVIQELAGGLGLREGVIARAFRDAHAARQHIAVAPGVWESVGRTWLQRPAVTSSG